MSGRLPAGIGVSALLRRVNDAGGLAVVRAKGDPQAGAVLVLIDEGPVQRAVERGLGPDGAPALVESRRTDTPGETLDDYWRRRRQRDPDLWVLELSIPAAERLVAETLLVD